MLTRTELHKNYISLSILVKKLTGELKNLFVLQWLVLNFCLCLVWYDVMLGTKMSECLDFRVFDANFLQSFSLLSLRGSMLSMAKLR